MLWEYMERKYIDSIRLKKKPPKNSYLNDIPAVSWLGKSGELSFAADVTFFVGENGTGKSTLLEGIAVASGFNPEGGTRNYSFSTSDTHSELYNYLTVAKCAYPKDGFFLRAESMYNAATYLEEIEKLPGSGSVLAGYGGKSLHSRSHGESFLAVVRERFRGNGLYLLDEPESALSPARLLTLLCLIKDLTSANSQFIIATHSPILMAFPDARILKFSDNGIEPVNYRQTEHYQITKQFLDNPERMLKILFEGEKEDI